MKQMTDVIRSEVKQEQINNAVWAACDTFRGPIDAANYKDYILVMLFLKYYRTFGMIVLRNIESNSVMMGSG